MTALKAESGRVVRLQNERGAKRVSALLQAAAQVFAEKGYDATTMTEIAQRAGSAIGSLYQFFSTKEAIAAALSREMQDVLLAGLARIEADVREHADTDIPSRMTGLFIQMRNEAPAFLPLSERPPPGSHRMRLDVIDAVQRVLAQRYGDLTDDKQRAMAVTLLTLCKAIASLTKTSSTEEEHNAAGELQAVMHIYLGNAHAGAPRAVRA